MDGLCRIQCQKVTISSPEHQSRLTEGMWNFFQAGYLTDLILSDGIHLIRAHRLIAEVFLSSDKLTQIFRDLSKFGEETDDSGNHLRCILDFLYNGTLVVDEDQLKNVLTIAKELDFTVLINAIETFSLANCNQFTEVAIQSSLVLDSTIDDISGTQKITNLDVKGKSPITAEPVLQSFTSCHMEVVPDSIYEMVAISEVQLGQVVVVTKEPLEIITQTGDDNIKGDAGKEESKMDSPEVQCSKRMLHSVKETKFGVPHKCPMCDSTFEYLSTLQLHQRIHATETLEKPVVEVAENKEDDLEPEIKVSGRLKETPASRKKNANHQLEAHEHECDLCSKIYKSKLSLAGHRRVHTGEQPFQCNACDAAFISRSKLNCHHKKNHADKKATDIFKCEECGKVFAKATLLAIHFRSHSGEKPYSCDICGKTFVHSGSIKLHKIKHRADPRPFKCELCPDKQYSQRHMLDVHMRNHTGERPYQCSFCGKGFTQSANMESHVRTHTQEKPYMCHVCGHSFNQKPALVRHSLTHSGEMNEVCSVCDRRFSHVQNLRDHMRTHTKERPFLCDICGATFPRRHHRANHVRRYHPS